MTAWSPFFVGGFGSTFTVYVLLQCVALALLRGRERLVSLAPLALMALVVSYAVSAYRQQANLWPIAHIFVSPVAAAFLCLLLASGLTARYGPRMAWGVAGAGMLLVAVACVAPFLVAAWMNVLGGV